MSVQHWGAEEILVALRREHAVLVREDLRAASGLGEEDFTEALAELVESGAVLSQGSGERTVYGLELDDEAVAAALGPPPTPPPPPAPPGTGGPDEPPEPEEQPAVSATGAGSGVDLNDPTNLRGRTAARMVALGIPGEGQTTFPVAIDSPIALLAAEAARQPEARFEVNARVRFNQLPDGTRIVTDVLEVYSVDLVTRGE